MLGVSRAICYRLPAVCNAIRAVLSMAAAGLFSACLGGSAASGTSAANPSSLLLYVQSRSYRAPEVILGLAYDHKVRRRVGGVCISYCGRSPHEAVMCTRCAAGQPAAAA